MALLALAAGVVAAACSPLAAINAFVASDTYEFFSARYGADGRHALDIYRPRAATGTAPVVVFFYGGSWRDGERNDYRFVGEALAARGIVAVIADYRVYPQVRYPDFLRDCAQAVAWTKHEIARFGGDAQRVFVAGHSAGAYNAAMIALDARWLREVGFAPSELSGWIGLAGPYDFLPIRNPDVKPVFFFPDTPPESQPIAHVSSGAPPALLLAAANDSAVNPVRNTEALAARLRDAGVPVRAKVFDGVSHTTLVATLAQPLRSLAPVLDEMVAFVAAPTR